MAEQQNIHKISVKQVPDDHQIEYSPSSDSGWVQASYDDLCWEGQDDSATEQPPTTSLVPELLVLENKPSAQGPTAGASKKDNPMTALQRIEFDKAVSVALNAAGNHYLDRKAGEFPHIPQNFRGQIVKLSKLYTPDELIAIITELDIYLGDILVGLKDWRNNTEV